MPKADYFTKSLNSLKFLNEPYIYIYIYIYKGLVSLFNSISNFVGSLIPKPFL